MKPFFLMPAFLADECNVPGPFGNSLEELERADFDLLVCFGTGVIVPKHILERAACAVNIHGASPAYPGRDPHHWAAYDGATTYGATLHYMAEKVDAGPIIDVELFPVPADCPPWRLLSQANEAGKKLLARFLDRYAKEGPPPSTDVKWGPRKTSRADFLELCRITPDMTAKEFQRRRHATAAPGRQNLYVDLHGQRFRIES